MTLSDLEWPFHASRAISVVAERLINCTHESLLTADSNLYVPEIFTKHWTQKR